MHLKQMFNKNAYNFNGRFNSAYMGSVLNMLKMSQHLYKREDIVKAYRFLADLIENGSFEWGGTFPLFPEEPKNPCVVRENLLILKQRKILKNQSRQNLPTQPRLCSQNRPRIYDGCEGRQFRGICAGVARNHITLAEA